MGKTAQSHAVRRMAVIQTGITRFNAVQASIESGCLNSDFGNQVASQMGLKIGWICRARRGEEACIQQTCYWRLTAHGAAGLQLTHQRVHHSNITGAAQVGIMAMGK